jgi:hypothetical protein
MVGSGYIPGRLVFRSTIRSKLIDLVRDADACVQTVCSVLGEGVLEDWGSWVNLTDRDRDED